LNKNFTSGRIITNSAFTYGRFEVRAALPEGKMLRPNIFMLPVNDSGKWAQMGEINVMSYIQDSKIQAGLHYNVPHYYDYNRSGELVVKDRLNHFHTYAIEWNKFEIKWYFDHINHLTININRKLGEIYERYGQPFDAPFRLGVNLGVGNPDLTNKFLTIDDVILWKCSLFIIDYIRIYKWINGTEKLNSTFDNISADNICSSVMPLITPKKNMNITLTTIFLIITSISLIVLIPIVVFSMIYLKKRKKNIIKSETNHYEYIEVDEHDYYNMTRQPGNSDRSSQNQSNNYESAYLEIK